MIKPGPERSCINCRAVREKNDLLRFVLTPERIVVPDLLHKLPGRGAYTCVRRSCLKGAADKKQFSRSFKGEVREADATGLIDQVISGMEERIASYIALANKAGKVVSGTDMVMDSMKKKTPGLLFIGSDISEDIGFKVKVLADRAGVEECSIFDKEKLGALIGKGLRGVVAIEMSGFIGPLKQEIVRFRNFLEEGR